MDPEPDTEELRLQQLERESIERELAERAPEESETIQHERRADKARYLRQKLDEQAQSKRGAAPERKR